MNPDNNPQVDLSLRRFIKELGCVAGGTALLAVTPWLKSCTPEKLSEATRQNGVARIGIIGTGSRGQYHIHNLLQIPFARITALSAVTSLDTA